MEADADPPGLSPSCLLACCDEAIVDASLDDVGDGPTAALLLLAWEPSDDSLLLDEAVAASAVSRFTRFRGLILCAVFGVDHGPWKPYLQWAVGPCSQQRKGRRVDIWFGSTLHYLSACCRLDSRCVAALQEATGHIPRVPTTAAIGSQR